LNEADANDNSLRGGSSGQAPSDAAKLPWQAATTMIQIFISHAGADVKIAERLAQDLKNAGHETKVDTRELRLGSDSIDFMNQSIADADAVLILHSKHTPEATWQQLEMNAALWNEIAQNGGKCIIIRLDDTLLPPLLGPKVYGTIDPTAPELYQKLLEDLCRSFLPDKTVSSIVSDAFRADSRNPFRRIRAEYFEDRPDLLARTFAPPDALKMGALEDVKPCFLEGSRGTGKSMLLLSLRARNLLLRIKPPPDRYRIFGFYLKLSRGAVCNAGVLSEGDSDPRLLEQEAIQVTDISSQERERPKTGPFLHL
jgi:TIR domain